MKQAFIRIFRWIYFRGVPKILGPVHHEYDKGYCSSGGIEDVNDDFFSLLFEKS